MRFSGSPRSPRRHSPADLSQNLAELAEAKRRLEAEQSNRAEFIRMIAHDLTQPLTAINGCAQLLGRPTLSEEARERTRATLLNQTRRMMRLVRDLSDAALLASGSFRIAPLEADLVDLVTEQVELARMDARGHPIDIDGPVDSIEVVCDRDRVAQVISNLLNNAIKYAPVGPIEVSVGIEDEQAVLTVRDHGPGIPEDRLRAIFEPNVRLTTSESSGPSGSGLGLYIAKGIVEAHGGQIWAESPGPGQGASFTVTLPLS